MALPLGKSSQGQIGDRKQIQHQEVGKLKAIDRSMESHIARKSENSLQATEKDESAEQRRTAILNRRRLANSNRAAGSGNEPSSTRISARSPIKQSFRMRSRARTIESNENSDAQDEYFSDEDEEPQQQDDKKQGKGQVEQEEEGDLATLVATSYPTHIYPLHLLPRSRYTEQITQPLLSIPTPNPHISTDDILGYLRCGSQCVSAPAESNGSLVQKRVSELELLGSTGSPTRLINSLHIGNEDKTSRDPTESDGLLADTRRLTSDTDSALSSVQKFDGMYVQSLPLLTQVLLSGESMPSHTAAGEKSSIFDDNMYSRINLSRATQRTMRELRVALDRIKVIKQFARENVEAEDRKGKQKQESSGSHHNHLGVDNLRELPSLNFLKQQILNDGSHPNLCILNVAENPVIEHLSQPQLPEPTIAYGGVLGQWSSYSSTKEVLGPIAARLSDSKNVKRSILRLHLHSVQLRTHPLMNLEETCAFNKLQLAYSKYSLLFEQRATGYLMYRLVALVVEIRDLVSKLPTENVDDTEVQLSDNDCDRLRCLYNDLISSIPVLLELRETIDNLSGLIHQKWTDLQEIRQRQGISTTKFHLVAKRIKDDSAVKPSKKESDESNTRLNRRKNSEANAELGQLDHTDEMLGHLLMEQNEWDLFVSCLDTVPRMITKVQDILFRKNLEKVKEENDEALVSGGAKSETVADEIQSPSRSGATRKDLNLVGLTASQQAEIKAESLRNTQLVNKLESCINSLIRGNGLLPEYVWKLTEDGTITDLSSTQSVAAATAQAELRRRQLLSAVQFQARVAINGKEITTSSLVTMNPVTMSVDFKQYFEFRVLSQPREITVDIFMNSPATGLASCCVQRKFLVGCVYVETPGSQKASGMSLTVGGKQKYNGVAHSYSPVTTWIEFSSLDSSISAKESASCFHSGSQTPLVEGSLLCTTEYLPATSEYYHSSKSQLSTVIDPVQVEEYASMPAAPAASLAAAAGDSKVLGSDSHIMNASSLGEQSSAFNRLVDFVRERDFQNLLPKLTDIDVNDPKNWDILLANARAPKITSSNIFHLAGLDYAAAFREGGHSYQNFVKFQLSLRMKLLALRDHSPHLFTEPIPLSDATIKGSELYKQIIAKHCPSESFDFGTEKDKSEETAPAAAYFEEANKRKISSFLDRVRSSQTAQTRSKKRKTFFTSSVIAETGYYKPLEMQELDLSFLAPKRRLKPTPQTRTPTAMHVEKINLLVQVVGARNVPVRSGDAPGISNQTRTSRNNATRGRSENADNNASAADLQLDESKLSDLGRIRTIVEIKFQENELQTTSVSGSAPLWKQSLAFPFRAPQDDCSPSNLEQVRDVVTFTLYDEVVEDDAKIGGFLEGEQTIRTDRRYLGSFTIPFLTIFREKRIEGVFRINTPVFNFGYEHSSLPSSSAAGHRRNEDRDGDNGLVPTSTAANWYWWPFDSLSTSITTYFENRRLANERRLVELRDNSYLIHRETQQELEYFASSEGSTFIKVLITLDPLLMTADEELQQDVASSSLHPFDRPFAGFAQTWLNSLESLGKHTKSRPYKIFGQNSTGQNVLICRYLTPMQPPPGFSTRRSVIHLVKQFPYIPDVQSFIGSMDLWCTVKQTYDIAAGDEEEHAVLLYNYMYYLMLSHSGNATLSEKLKAATKGHANEEFVQNESLFLVLGKAIPEGESVYVCMRDYRKRGADRGSAENYLLINAMNGNIYSAQDPNAPLRDVYLMATPYNLWANIQLSSHPADIRYDVTNTADWRPFFGARNPIPPAGLASIQEEIIYNELATATYASEVEKHIRQSIKTNIRRWRSKRHRSATSFHPDASSIMNDILPQLENWSRYGSTHGEGGEVNTNSRNRGDAMRVLQDEINSKMATILRTRRMRGCPINIPFSDVEDVMAQIKALRIHENKHPEVQFVMAVRAFPIANTLLSLWIYIGTLETVS